MAFDVADFQNALAGWIEVNGMRPVHFYSGDEWRAREEGIGDDAHLSAVIESSELATLLNSVGTSNEDQYASFVALLESLGWVFELGYAWSVHFWPDEVPS